MTITATTLLALAPLGIALLVGLFGVTIVGVASAFGKKKTTGGGPEAEHAILTGTVGDLVYQVEFIGNQYRWAVSGPVMGASAESSAEGALRTMYGFAFNGSAKEASVTGAIGPYSFAVELKQNGDWGWIGTDLGGGGDVQTHIGTSGSRGVSTIQAIQWLVERGAAEWLAAPKSIPEGPVGVPQPGKKPGLAPQPGKTGATAGAAQLDQKGPFPGLHMADDGNVHLIDAKAWAFYARPRIVAELQAGGGVGGVIHAVFGEEPHAGVKFNGKPWSKVKPKIIEAMGKMIQPKATYIPEPDEWLANLLVGYYPTYKGAAQYYKGHALVSRPGPAGVAPEFSWRWWVWEGRRELDDVAEHQGVAASAMDGLKRAKVQVDAEG